MVAEDGQRHDGILSLLTAIKYTHVSDWLEIAAHLI